MAFRFDKLTIKAQEADAAGASNWPPIAAIRRSIRSTCSPACWPKARAHCGRFSKNRRESAQLEKIVEAELGHFPRVAGGAAATWRGLSQVLEAAPSKPTR